MKLANLPAETRERIRQLRYDRIIEKHEGPEKWSWVVDDFKTDFLVIEGRHVLLPVPEKRLRNLTVLRCIPSADGQSLTLFLKDTTFVEGPEWESLLAGFIAICDKLPGEEFFVAIVYHEWYISAGYRLSHSGS
jgi:hypothetical protein